MGQFGSDAVSTESVVTITFHSDFVETAKGFKLEYFTVPRCKYKECNHVL